MKLHLGFLYVSLLLIVTFLVILPLHRAHKRDRLWLNFEDLTGRAHRATPLFTPV